MKPIIYQLLLRTWANPNDKCRKWGTLQENGSGKFNHITPKVLDRLSDLGATHIWYTGILEHSHDADYTAYGIERDNAANVKGRAGSPYAISDYYDVDPDLAEDVDKRMAEFEAMIERTHNAGLKAIIDFVPNHVARRYHSDAAPFGVNDFGVDDDKEMFFSPRNNFYYITRQQLNLPKEAAQGHDPYTEFPAKASGNDCYTAYPGVNDWFDTVKLNYGVDPANGSGHFFPIPDTWMKMLNILRYWCGKGVDGFRCDMAHMVPLEFWQWAIPRVKGTYPHVVFIAEIYDVALYRPYIHQGGFDYLYDKVTLYDTLRGIRCHGVSAAALTSCWQTVEGITPNMLSFLENHDEQRFGSPQYAGDPRLALPSMVVCATMSTGPLMIYGGQELGEQALESEGFSGLDGRSTIFDYWSTPSVRRWLAGVNGSASQLSPCEKALREQYRRLLKFAGTEKAVTEGKFFDLMYVNYDNPGLNPHRQYAYMRHAGAGHTLLIAVNFDDHGRQLSINIPRHAFENLGLTPGKYEAKDMLKGTVMDIELSDSTPFTTPIDANDAVIWCLRRKKAVTTGPKTAKKH